MRPNIKNVRCLRELEEMGKRKEGTKKTNEEIELVDISSSQETFGKRGYDLSSLHYNRYISDDVINNFSSVLMKKDKDILITNTQFYPSLIERKWAGISHWKCFNTTRRMTKDYIRRVKWLLIPVHQPDHWILMAYNHR